MFPKVIEIGILFINASLLTFQLSKSPTPAFSSAWSGVAVSSSLSLVVLSSLLLSRPFALQYAMDATPEAYWTTPIFKDVCWGISAAWGGCFAAQAGMGVAANLLYPDNVAAKIAPGIVLLLVTIKFGKEYPEYVKKKAAKNGPLLGIK